MSIRVDCPCGRRIKAPDGKAGQTVRCMYCGRGLPVPEAQPQGAVPEPGVEDEVSAGAAPPAARHHRLPVLAIVLAIVALIDTAVVGVSISLVWLVADRAAEHAQDSLADAAAEQAADPADAVVRQLREEGKNITLNQVMDDKDGRRYRQIEYTDRAGARGLRRVDLGAGSVKTLDPSTKKEMERSRFILKVAATVGFLLAATALAKLACSIGFFMRRNWGRAGLAGLSGLQSAMVVAGVLAGGASPYLLASLVVNGMICFYFLSAPVRAACDE